ncbi:MAG TPA: ribonuclease HII [Pyrinomonadaceae bacterium]|nr:ribonuclease HII [Pyrinomonadaceae bacterium]
MAEEEKRRKGEEEKNPQSQIPNPQSNVSASPRLRVSTIGLDFERQAESEGFRFIAGIDEVGRGCLAGAVVAAACILDLSKPLPEGLNDSKKLTAKKRDSIVEEIKQNALAYSIAQIEAEEIDRINILQATKKAMRLAVENLHLKADFLLIDAVQLKEIPLPQKAIIKGDAISASIAAASILAKTYRDNLMQEFDKTYPEYGFSKHVGYGTKAHFEALRKHGACPLHRKSFRGVLPDTV